MKSQVFHLTVPLNSGVCISKRHLILILLSEMIYILFCFVQLYQCIIFIIVLP